MVFATIQIMVRVINDMKVIKSHGFTTVRTYISKFGDNNLGQLVASNNLTAALGVPFPQPDYVHNWTRLSLPPIPEASATSSWATKTLREPLAFPRNTEVINFSGIAVNVHPYFTPGTTSDNAINVVNDQWTVMVKNFGDKLLVTETGWPSDGTLSGSTGSVAGLQTFYSDYKAWSKSAFEKSFGLLTSDATVKFDLTAAVNVAGTVSV
ncbi:Glycoside hydrolase superfamily [Phytophthora cactorum]|nr:Glycoside hydrolase superfamily [Phytophthora cactorum]